MNSKIDSFKGKFVKNTRYYRGEVYEWNLPTGTTCPFAMECKVSVDRQSGKFSINRGEYKCYAASAERFPGVREHRWRNFEFVKNGGIPELPKNCRALRIHAAGDFFNQKYFDNWVSIAEQNPNVEMWAYTKSIRYWIKRIKEIPENLILTASYGGRDDEMIELFRLKNVKVYPSVESVPSDRKIDTNDDLARKPWVNFALIDNFAPLAGAGAGAGAHLGACLSKI
jgi:hypothetical protein